GVTTTMKLVEELRGMVADGLAKSPDQVEKLLKEQLVEVLRRVQRPYLAIKRELAVILVVGVNGSGKTTSIGKLAKYHRDAGQKVVLAAGDTFRAAASDQLEIWGERVGVPVISHQPGSDPGAVAFDAVQAAQSRGADVLIVDTAGRLHTKFNLMRELRKVREVLRRQVPGAPHEILLVLDATTGQNALTQAKRFRESVDLTGVVLAKLDGSSKGGIVFAVANELNLPVMFAATGETVDDLAPFEPKQFVEDLF
ncbi:MAG: signal recognition particle-docking protein FtsY, partial [Chloroflexi bacterium]|nr:signal recognition particle-docking protein FtsY [Chloroflexota bacterium]